jgi:hypothetical protein
VTIPFIGCASDAHRTRIGFKFGCTSDDTHSMRGAVYVPVDVALFRLECYVSCVFLKIQYKLNNSVCVYIFIDILYKRRFSNDVRYWRD